jgi:hypothetical protein
VRLRAKTGHSAAAAARLRAACSRSITARQPGLTCARFLAMQAVILWMLGTSWPHSRMASPVHICCASDENARLGRADSAVAARAMAKRSGILLVRWKVMDASPRLRAVLAAVHWGRCTRFALPHASSITRESPGMVARFLPMFESKVLRRPR